MMTTEYEIIEVEKGHTSDKSIISISTYMGMFASLKGLSDLRLKSSHEIRTKCCGERWGEMHIYEELKSEDVRGDKNE